MSVSAMCFACVVLADFSTRDIFLQCNSLKVLRVNATPYAAKMIYLIVLGDWPFVDLVGDPVRPNRSKRSVSLFVPYASPQPASSIWLWHHVIPKAIFDCAFSQGTPPMGSEVARTIRSVRAVGPQVCWK